MIINDLKNKRVTLMGLGSYKEGTGISTALFLASLGAKVLVTDLRSENELKDQIKKLKKFKNIKFALGGHKEEDFKNCDMVVRNPGVPKDSKYLKIAEKNNIPIENDWSIFLSFKKNMLVGVTGTRGKSTTVSLLNDFLKNEYKTHLCGNIGKSPLAIASKVQKDDLIVAEFSSWLLNGFQVIEKSPQVSVITNLMPDHLNKYKNLRDYYNDKKYIFKYQKKTDVLILNKDDKESKKLPKEVKSKIYWFSKKPFSKKDDGIFLVGNNIFFQEKEAKKEIANISTTKLKGEHNKSNILAAVCAAVILGVKNSDIQKGINSFSGVHSRLECVRSLKGVQFYNDTTATSPDGAIAALLALGSKEKNIILLAGGSDKKLDYTKFALMVKKYVKSTILFSGDATEKIKKEFKKVNYKNISKETSNMKEAVDIALKNSKKGDIILLSPGAASFGLFKNEFDRGEQFCDIVKALK